MLKFLYMLFIGPLQQFFLIVVFQVNECQTKILRCAPPSSHVCDFSYKYYYYTIIFTERKSQ